MRCDEVGWFSFLTYGWVSPLVASGVRRQVDLGDTPQVAASEDIAANARALLGRLAVEERSQKAHPLLRAVVGTYWRPLLVRELLKIGEHCLTLVNPLLLQQVLIFQEAQEEDRAAIPAATVRSGMAAVVGLVALGLFSIAFNSQVNLFHDRLKLRIDYALKAAVLHRCIKGQPPSDAAPEAGKAPGLQPSVYNVMSFDVGLNIDIIWVVADAWLFPIQFVTSLVVLFQQVHTAVVPCLVVIIAAKAFCFVLLVKEGLLRHRHLAAKDLRLDLCAEGFRDIRTLQMLAWARPFVDRMLAARASELRLASLRLWTQKMPAALDYSLGALVTLTTLSYYTLVDGNRLKASVALPVIALVTSLVGPFGQLPVFAQRYLVWRSAYERVNSYIGVAGSGRGAGSAAPSEPRPEEAPPADAVAALTACTMRWPSAVDAAPGESVEGREMGEVAFSLRRVDLRLRAGEVLVLCGAQGQGKSSLLQGLLGELAVREGAAASPAIARRRLEEAEAGASAPRSLLLPPPAAEGRQPPAGPDGLCVPFAAQRAALFAGTVRSNILFGAPLDTALLERVVEACALGADLAAMPAGDLTEVAQDGVTLSGGQRARVGLARAVYHAAVMRQRDASAAPLVLLDDPFCALDRAAARQVSGALFSGLLAGCAVVVGAADPWWVGCLRPDIDVRLAVLRQGEVVCMGAPDALLRGGHAVDPALRAALQAATQVAPAPAAPWKSVGDAPTPANRQAGERAPPDGEKVCDALLKEESRNEGGVAWHIYWIYLRAVRPCFFAVMLLSLAGIMLFQNMCTLWVAYWTMEDKESVTSSLWFRTLFADPPDAPKELLVVYAILVACFTFCNFAGHATEIVGGIRAARKIFADSLTGTLWRPFMWWDANPVGRVMNRFSEDVEVMDKAVTNIIGVLFGAVLFLIGNSTVLAISNPWTLVILPFCIAGMEFYGRYYRKTIRELQRIYLVSVSSVYQDMVEAILGRVTIRAFASSQRVMWASVGELDELQRAFFAKQALGLWITLRLSLIGFVLGIYTTLQPVLQYHGVLGSQSAALVGFSIEYSRGIVGVIQQLILNYSELEMQLVSIERLNEYAGEEPPAEASASLSGDLLLEGVAVTYRLGLPPALSGVDLRFPPGEVAAVVGRTGAGKSSLLLSILQLVPYSGRISVGGADLAAEAPAAVRAGVVGVVPQQPVLFEGGLRWNLDPTSAYSDVALRAALEAVGLAASPEVMRLWDGASGAGDGLKGLHLSHGQQQLLCAARVLLRRPSVVLLDEVTAALPPASAMSTASLLVRTFRGSGAVTLLVAHQDDLQCLCDRVVTVAAGCVVGDERRAAAS